MARPTTIANATVKLSALNPAAGANQACIGTGGIVTTVASGTACASSAKPYKIALEDITAGNRVSLLQPAVFQYKDTERFGNRLHVGLYAEDVQQMDPRCVVYVDGKLENYEDRCVLAYGVAAIKQLKAELDDVKMRLGMRP